MTIAILDEKGQVVRTLAAPKNAGLNRVHWDFRYEPTNEVRLRTSPLYAPDIRPGPEGWRSGGQRFSILAPPGTYTVKLSVGGRDLTEPLTVRKDPHSGGSEAEIAEQIKMLFELRADIESAADLINGIELVRSQLQSLPRLIQDTEVTKTATGIEQKFIELEGNLLELRSTGRGQDGVRWGAKLYQKFDYLASGLMSNDYRPTAQQLEVKASLEEQLRAHQGQFTTLVNTDLAAFNDVLRKRNVPIIFVPSTRKTSN